MPDLFVGRHAGIRLGQSGFGSPGAPTEGTVIAWMWLTGTAGAGAPLEVRIADPSVLAVVLLCGQQTLRSEVKAGVASFLDLPDTACTVDLVRRSGKIDAPGQWSCTLDACAQDDVHHAVITNSAKRVNVVLTTPLPAGTQLEVNCPDGSYRERKSPVENTATFDGVPSEECALLFKGGTPAKYSPVKYGTYYCSLTSSTAVCTLK